MPALSTAATTGASPQDAGFASDLADKLDAGIRSGLLSGVHAVLVSRDERLVLERYCQGTDETWGRPLGTISSAPTRCTICDR